MGYSHIGHVFSSNNPGLLQEEQSNTNRDYKKIVIGDDLGSETYLLAHARLEFLSLPLLKTYGLRTFLYGECAFYPSLKQ